MSPVPIWIKKFRDIFNSNEVIPEEHRKIFFHYNLDAGWYGLLNASTLTFLAVYLTRLGATNLQIGLLNAAPAVANILFTLPAGNWIERWPIGKTVFWASVLQRIFFFLLILLPWLLLPQIQIWTAILIILIMNIPSTVLAVGFNALFAEIVPVDWRSYLAGTRNILLSIVTIIILILCGEILDRVYFPAGYQIVFTIGFIGAAMSSLQLFYISSSKKIIPQANKEIDICDEQSSAMAEESRLQVRIRMSLLKQTRKLHLEALSGSFGIILLLMFAINLSIYLVIPVIQLYVVNGLHLTDRVISLGNSFFYLAGFLASTQTRRLAKKFGNKNVVGIGTVGLAIFPFFISLWRSPSAYLFLNVVAGSSWILINTSLLNYLFEKIPFGELPSRLAWYNMALNIAMLVGALSGAAFAGWVGLASALLILAISRIIAGIALIRWG